MKSYYLIFDGREYYKVNEEGFISRRGIYIGMPEREWGPATADWRALALVQRDNFGNVAEVVLFVHWDKNLPASQRYKNGKAKYRLVDLDHGTRREWGNPVTVQKLTEKES